MRKLILTFVFGTLSLCAFSQEAFYIYRNDGDFNGFFYDEVIEMRQSKIGVDSIEYDKWVTQEVVLADTTYRIPLAAIDSIGFQQPEIKLNPNVRFVEDEGLCPYMTAVSETMITFTDLPLSLIPQVGYILIGLPTDSCKALYEELGGSVGLVVQSVNIEGNITYVNGRSIEEISEVFEQLISVEQIGVDTLGNTHYRMAGRMPRNIHRVPMAEGNSSLDLVDFNGSFTRDWQPAGDSSKTKVNVTADMNIKVRLRAAYDIRWYKIYVKLSHDYMFRVKPSVGISGTLEWKVSTDDLVKEMPGVLFPGPCPLFEIKPFPALFMNVSGTIDARINLPQVYLGFGDDIIMNSTNIIFPVMYTLHLVPDENKEPTQDMLDFSAAVKFSGSIYTGIAFQAILNTNSYFRKIFQCGIGLNFYVGPKVTGELSFNLADITATPAQTAYSLLSNTNLTMNYLSLGMDVTAKAKIGWGDDKETTFFSGNRDYFKYTMRLAPTFQDTETECDDNGVRVTLKPEPTIALLYTKFDAAFYDPDKLSRGEEPDLTIGKWEQQAVILPDKEYSVSSSLDKLKAITYNVGPYVYGPGGPFFVGAAKADVSVPLTISFDTDSMHFDTQATTIYTIPFTTNCPASGIRFSPGFYLGDSLTMGTINVINEDNGNYELVCSAFPNERLFSLDDIYVPKSSKTSPGIYFDAGGDVKDSVIHISFSQDKNMLKEVLINFSGQFEVKANETGQLEMCEVVYNGSAKATRTTPSIINVEDTIESGDKMFIVSLEITQNQEYCEECVGEQYRISGTVTNTTSNDMIGISDARSIRFSNVLGQGKTFSGAALTITEASYHHQDYVTNTNEHGQVEIVVTGNTFTYQPGSDNNKITGTIKAKIDSAN